MATRSNIAIKLRKEDIGKTFTFDPSMMAKAFSNKFPFEPVKIRGEYMVVYHHWDGYPEGVGATLLAEFNDYNSILNLLLMGDLSSINGDEVVSYHGWRNEDTPPSFTDEYPEVNEEYLYVFEDGEWYVSENGEDKKLLKEVLA